MTKWFRLNFYAEIGNHRVKTYERVVDEDGLHKLADTELNTEARKHALQLIDDVYCTIEEIEENV